MPRRFDARVRHGPSADDRALLLCDRRNACYLGGRRFCVRFDQIQPQPDPITDLSGGGLRFYSDHPVRHHRRDRRIERHTADDLARTVRD